MTQSGNITPRQAEVLEYLTANGRSTARDIASNLGMSRSTVYDHTSALDSAGYTVANVNGEYLYVEEDSSEGVANPVSRMPDQVAQQTITKRANQSLSEMKDEILTELQGLDAPVADGGLAYQPGNQDMVVPCHDDHFGEVVKDERSNVQFNSQIAEDRVYYRFDEVVRYKNGREAMGDTIDTLHIPMYGDIVTNEAIYRSQPHHIDAKVRDQVRHAAEVYLDNIKRMSNVFPSVQVVCQHGNHGEFRVDGASGQANADDLLYAMLDMLIRENQDHGDLENVTLRYSDETDYMNFRMRVNMEEDRRKAEELGLDSVEKLPPEHQSGLRAHMRHGDNARNHIGTSSPQSDWLFWKAKHKFDIAYRGHYHEYRVEPLPDGTPVLEGGSIKEPGQYEEELGVGGMPINVIHGVTDDDPIAWQEKVTFN